MKMVAFVLIALLVMLPAASAHAVDAQKFFDLETKKLCPNHHIEWVGDGGYDELIEAYEKKMSPYIRRKIDKIANYSRNCSSVDSGFYCMWQVTINAYKKIDRLNDFSVWTCRHVNCREVADCKIEG